MENIILYCGVKVYDSGVTIFVIDEEQVLNNNDALIDIPFYTIEGNCCNHKIKEFFWYVESQAKDKEERNRIFALIIAMGFIQTKRAIEENPFLFKNGVASVVSIDTINMFVQHRLMKRIVQTFKKEVLEDVFYTLQTIGGELYIDTQFEEKKFIFN